MSQPIISVEHLSKAYRLGMKEEVPDTFVGAMTGWLKAPVRNWKRLKSLNTFNEPVANGALAVADDNTASPQANGQPDDILWALRDVSFEVHEGEVVGIIGRNGAGKSTLLKILSRITEPTHGRAVIRGRVSSLLEVGTGFHPELTGRENIYMNGTILGMRKKEIDKKFDEIVDFSGVEKFLDTPIKRYSSGMQVRLAFAVAAHLEPEILIIDEVLAVGDAEFQKKCLGKMQDVAKSGRTVLFVSHNMAAVEALCSRGITLQQGRINCDSDTREAINTYINEMPRTFTGRLRLKGENSLIRSISLRGDEENENHSLLAGESLLISLEISSQMPKEASITLGIDNSLNQRMLTIPCYPHEEFGETWTQSNFLACNFRDFPLAAGSYQLTIVCRLRNEIIEAHHNVLTFDIQENPVLVVSGRYTKGLCIARTEWRCTSLSPLSSTS